MGILPDKLYHFTFEDNLKSILSKELSPYTDKLGNPPLIWMTATPPPHNLFDIACPIRRIAVLEITTKGLDPKYLETSGKAICYSRPIPNKNIKVAFICRKTPQEEQE